MSKEFNDFNFIGVEYVGDEVMASIPPSNIDFWATAHGLWGYSLLSPTMLLILFGIVIGVMHVLSIYFKKNEVKRQAVWREEAKQLVRSRQRAEDNASPDASGQ